MNEQFSQVKYANCKAYQIDICQVAISRLHELHIREVGRSIELPWPATLRAINPAETISHNYKVDLKIAKSQRY